MIDLNKIRESVENDKVKTFINKVQNNNKKATMTSLYTAIEEKYIQDKIIAETPHIQQPKEILIEEYYKQHKNYYGLEKYVYKIEGKINSGEIINVQQIINEFNKAKLLK